jgi:hypothetical protein
MLLAVCISGCNGGTVDRHALARDTATLDSIACEGALVADGVARGRTTSHFVRVHADVLREQSSNLANALSSRDTVAGIEQEVRRTGREAALIARTLELLRARPTEAATADQVRRVLRRLGSCG